MPTDASIAMRVTDNLSSAIVGMKNAVSGFRGDVESLQKKLDILDRTKIQLKNVDMKGAKAEIERTRKAFEELGESAGDAERAAAEADWREAEQNYENLRRQLDLVSKQARQTERDMLGAADAISRTGNRAAGGNGSAGAGDVLSALGKAGLANMAGDVAGQWANALIGSAFGGEAGGMFSGALSGAVSGAAIGSIIPGIGTAVGAAVGGALGLAGGAAQAFESRDSAFKDYYGGLYDTAAQGTEESLASGSATAGQRELDAIAFERLLGEGVGEQYLKDLRSMAAATPMEYGDLTGMSRALATGFGDSPERMLALMTAIGDAGSAVGVTASDMTEMARAMSRMNSSGKASLEFLNIFQDRGVDVIGMLGKSLGKTQGEIYDMISKGEINGRDAAEIIQKGMEDSYSGAMAVMAETYDGLTSTLHDAMTEIDNAVGERYNAGRASGIQAEIDAYGGPLGDALSSINGIIGDNKAYMENLGEQYQREALSAVFLGKDTTVYNAGDSEKLRKMGAEYRGASFEYEQTGSREAALTMERLKNEAEALATAAYESSHQYQAVVDAQVDSIAAIRENTSGLAAATNAYQIAQARDIGAVGGFLSQANLARGSANIKAAVEALGGPANDTYFDIDPASVGGFAYGLDRVPYDDYPALLHQGERVLTAQEAREADRGGAPGPVSVHVDTLNVRQESDVYAVAEELADLIEQKRMAGVRT